MLLHRAFVIPLAAALALPAGAALSQESAPAAAPSAAPSSLVFYFDAGSAKVRPKDLALFSMQAGVRRTAAGLFVAVLAAAASPLTTAMPGARSTPAGSTRPAICGRRALRLATPKRR